MILGYQIVLLDEYSHEIRRLADMYEGYADFVLDAHRYDLIRTRREQGQVVRYFKRASTGDGMRGRRTITQSKSMTRR